MQAALQQVERHCSGGARRACMCACALAAHSPPVHRARGVCCMCRWTWPELARRLCPAQSETQRVCVSAVSVHFPVRAWRATPRVRRHLAPLPPSAQPIQRSLRRVPRNWRRCGCALRDPRRSALSHSNRRQTFGKGDAGAGGSTAGGRAGARAPGFAFDFLRRLRGTRQIAGCSPGDQGRETG
eukprot:scaffold14373_cov149-Isochrysis_galbana.AAC.1